MEQKGLVLFLWMSGESSQTTLKRMIYAYIVSKNGDKNDVPSPLWLWG